jgi:hypothetical protein
MTITILLPQAAVKHLEPNCKVLSNEDDNCWVSVTIENGTQLIDFFYSGALYGKESTFIKNNN